MVPLKMIPRTQHVTENKSARLYPTLGVSDAKILWNIKMMSSWVKPYPSRLAWYTWCSMESVPLLFNAHTRHHSVDCISSLSFLLAVDSDVHWALSHSLNTFQPLGHRAARKHVKRSVGHSDSGTKWYWRKGQSLSVCFVQRGSGIAVYNR